MKSIATIHGNVHLVDTGDGIELHPPNGAKIELDYRGMLELYEGLEYIIAMVNDDGDRRRNRPIETVELPEPAEASDD